jgi:hypothetical protein
MEKNPQFNIKAKNSNSKFKSSSPLMCQHCWSKIPTQEQQKSKPHRLPQKPRLLPTVRHVTGTQVLLPPFPEPSSTSPFYHSAVLRRCRRPLPKSVQFSKEKKKETGVPNSYRTQSDSMNCGERSNLQRFEILFRCGGEKERSSAVEEAEETL